MGFAIYSPKGELLASYDAPEDATCAGHTLYAGKVGWIERTSDHALIGSPGGMDDLKKEKRLALVRAWQKAHPAPVAPETPPAPVEQAPRGDQAPPQEPAIFTEDLEQGGASRNPPADPAPSVNEEPLPAPEETPPPAAPLPPEERLASLLSAEWRSRDELAQLAGLEPEATWVVLMGLLDAGRARWLKGRWAAP